MTRQVGEVAYELELPQGSKVQNAFHVLCLKKALGQQVTAVRELPSIYDEGNLVFVLEAILEMRERKLGNRTVWEFLVKWKDVPEEDATWEGEQVL